MPQFVRRAQPPLHFIPTAYTPWVIRLVHWALPFLLRVRIRPWLPAGIHHIDVENVDRLVDLYAQFEAGNNRFLMAVRHVEVDDPLSGLYLCSRAVKQAAKARGIKLRSPIHIHFLYDRGMTIWAGKGIGWLLSRIGGVPIRRGRKPDWVALKAARKLMSNGQLPMVVAPEGATNGHSQRLGPLEPGVVQLGFWCAEDLQRAGRTEAVLIVPVGIQYHHVQPNWPRLATVLSELEAQSGLSAPYREKASKAVSETVSETVSKPVSEPASEPVSGQLSERCYLRILRLAEHLMTVMEDFYHRCYHQKFADENTSTAKSVAETAVTAAALTEKETTAATEQTNRSTPTVKPPKEACSQRLHRLLDSGLGISEAFFNLSGKGTFVDRCRRIEEASWNYIYREDLPVDLHQLSPLERGLADWAAQEASLRELHMRMVESFVAVDGAYLNGASETGSASAPDASPSASQPSFERCAETTLLMSDMLARLSGDKLPSRPRLGDRWVKMTVQEPIEIIPHLASYQKSRRAGRAAVAAVTEQVRQALEETIEY